jgi:hypothetical protein
MFRQGKHRVHESEPLSQNDVEHLEGSQKDDEARWVVPVNRIQITIERLDRFGF